MTQERKPASDTSTFETLHLGLTVDLIATPRSELETCRPDETISQVQERNARGYDYLPIEDNGSIIGLFHAKKLMEDADTDDIVEQHTDSLSDSNLIGAEASILDFLKEVDSKPFRLVVSGGGIDGLVAWSDLQKLPVRVALFSLITGLELIMSKAIRNKYPNGDGWLEHLSSERRSKLEASIRQRRSNDSDIHPLLETELSDKAAILRKMDAFQGRPKAVKRILGKIVDLRNSVAHAKDYLRDRESASKLSKKVKGLFELHEEIADLVGTIA